MIPFTACRGCLGEIAFLLGWDIGGASFGWMGGTAFRLLRRILSAGIPDIALDLDLELFLELFLNIDPLPYRELYLDLT